MNNKGFSLIELVVAIVVIGIGVASFATLMNATTVNSIDPMIRQQANSIARAYLEEISLKQFCDSDFDPDGDGLNECSSTTAGEGCTESACAAASTNTCGGPNGPTSEGTNRALFDDVCDYTNLPDTVVRDQTGNQITDLNDFSVTVTINDAAGANLNGLNGTSGRSLRIDVRVTHANLADVDITVTGYRTNF